LGDDVAYVVSGGGDVLAEGHSGHLARVQVGEGWPAAVSWVDRCVNLNAKQPSGHAVPHLRMYVCNGSEMT
jgi:hypothetical protein